MKHLIKISIVIFIQITLFLGCVDKSEKKNVKVFWGLMGQYPEEKQYNPYELTREDKEIDAASILYSIRRDYKTIEQISKQTEIDIRNVEKKLAELKNCELVTEKDKKFIVNFPFWDIPLRDTINSLGLELSNQIAGVIKSEIPNLKLLFEKTSFPEQGYNWDDVSLIIIGGLLFDTGLNDRGLRKMKIFSIEDMPVRPGNYYYWYRAVENGWGNYWKFGHDMNNDDFNVWFGMFYGNIKGREIKWGETWDVFNKNTRKFLFPIIKKGKIQVNELYAELEMQRDSFDIVLHKMEEVKMVKIKDSVIIPNFPVFQEKDIQILLTKVDSICNMIITDIYIPFLPKIQKTWKDNKPPNWDIKSVDKLFIREVYDRPYNLTLDILIRENILPPSPVEPPFDYWGLNGYFEVL